MDFIKEILERNIRSYITSKAKNIAVDVVTLDKISDEYGIESIVINEYDPAYMTSDELEITNSDLSTKIFKLPAKKKIDKDYIISKVISMKNIEKSYINLSKKFKSLIKNIDNMNIYPTSYGIGVHTIYSKTDDEFKVILDMLDENNIKYKLEWSRAMWVKRIIISKTKENISNINKIK